MEITVESLDTKPANILNMAGDIVTEYLFTGYVFTKYPREAFLFRIPLSLLIF